MTGVVKTVSPRGASLMIKMRSICSVENTLFSLILELDIVDGIRFKQPIAKFHE